MKIFYDYQIFSLQSHGGISRYFSELATRMALFPGTNVLVCALVHRNSHVRQSHRPGGGGCSPVIGLYIPHIPKTGKIRQFCNSILSSGCLKSWQPDISHETYYAPGSMNSRNVKTVITVHDMIHERFPGSAPRRDRTASLKKAAISRADHIICVSHNTRNDLLECYPVDPGRVSVVHLGCSLTPLDNPVREQPGITRPYLLYVGQRTGHKNFRNFLKAYASSRRLKDTFGLLCFGGGAFTPQEVRFIGDLHLDPARILQISGEDQVLAGLYAHAAAFVYPSIYEGFGIPPLEAMSFRCPVVCSNTGSLPEVVGEAAELFNPDDVEHIMNAVERVAFSPARSDELISLGLRQVAKFSWDRCALETYHVYQKLSTMLPGKILACSPLSI
ncbi:MAG: glycosyltransferase family 1 protein [bacterium]